MTNKTDLPWEVDISDANFPIALVPLEQAQELWENKTCDYCDQDTVRTQCLECSKDQVADYNKQISIIDQHSNVIRNLKRQVDYAARALQDFLCNIETDRNLTPDEQRATGHQWIRDLLFECFKLRNLNLQLNEFKKAQAIASELEGE